MPLLTAEAAAAAVAAAGQALVEEAVAEEVGVVVPVAVGPLALELVVDLVVDLVAGRDLATVIPAVAVMLSDILTLVHTDGLTRTASARECFGFEGTITFGMAAGLALGLVTLLVGFANARPSRVGMCGGKRRTSAMSTGLTRIRG
jgi:hypothetical protein